MILIHGVGAAQPGACLLDATAGIGARDIAGTSADLVIGGVRFPRLSVDHTHVDEVIEVNWAEVAKPPRSVTGLVDYGVRIMVAALHIGARQRCARWYKACFEALLVYCLYPPVTSVFWALWPQPWQQVVTGTLAVASIALVTAYLSRFHRLFRLGWLWAAAIAVETAALAAHRLSLESAIHNDAVVYVLAQSVSSALLLIALIEQLSLRSASLDCRIAGMGLLYFPFFVASAIGALIWMAVLFSLNKFASTAVISSWEGLFVEGLRSVHYDLALIEWTFAALIALLGFALSGIVLIYLRRASRKVSASAKNSGSFARDGLEFVLAAGALIFAVLSAVYAVSAAAGWQSEASASVLKVYGLSSLRILPYLGVLIGPLAVIVDVAVDILFYVVPSNTGLSTASLLHHRLRMVIEYALSRRQAPVVICAHSQGSVIAIDVVGRVQASNRSAPLFLITAGSPIETLYHRFLASTPEARAATMDVPFSEPSPWLNIFREGDYIGGEQNRHAVEEYDLGRGGHLRYWRSEELWRKVFSFLDAHRTPRTG